MKITQYDFNKLHINKKYELLIDQGIFLHNRLYEGYGINLYSIYGFYAEIWLNRESNKIEKVITFTQSRYLEPYLDSIEIF